MVAGRRSWAPQSQGMVQCSLCLCLVSSPAWGMASCSLISLQPRLKRSQCIFFNDRWQVAQPRQRQVATVQLGKGASEGVSQQEPVVDHFVSRLGPPKHRLARCTSPQEPSTVSRYPQLPHGSSNVECSVSCIEREEPAGERAQPRAALSPAACLRTSYGSRSARGHSLAPRARDAHTHHALITSSSSYLALSSR